MTDDLDPTDIDAITLRGDAGMSGGSAKEPSPFDAIAISARSQQQPPLDHPGMTGSPTLKSPGHDQTNDSEGDKGAGGVCAAPSAAAAPLQAPASSPEPASLIIPDQPLPPGAPAALAASMSGVTPNLSTMPTGSEPLGAKTSAWSQQQVNIPHQSVRPDSGLSTKPPVGPAELPPPVNAGPFAKRNGHVHPWKPQTPDQIAEFANLWYDPAYTNDQIARKYKAGASSIDRWRVEYGLGGRTEAMRAGVTANDIISAASGVVSRVNEMTAVSAAMDRAAARTGQVMDPKLDPMKDAEIVTLINDMVSEARIMTAHSDLQVLQRKLMRVAVIVNGRAPVQSWAGLALVMEGLSRTILYARRVEAEIPSSSADPVLLRREAAGQLMRELKSVLTPEEQNTLATIVKAGADRLMKRGGDAGTIAAEVA